MIGPEDLIAEAVRAARRRVSRYRARADDFVGVELSGESRESLTLAVLEANATVALPIGNRCRDSISYVRGSGACVNSGGTTFLHIFRKAEGAYLVAVLDALKVHGTNISLDVVSRKAKLKTDAVTLQAVALAVGDAVIDEAASLGT
jgi:hypothetical protein